MTLASIPEDKPPFEKVLKDQINELRKQLEKEGPEDPGDTTAPARSGLRQLESIPPSSGHNAFLPLDASGHRVAKGDSMKKLFTSGRIDRPNHLKAAPIDMDTWSLFCRDRTVKHNANYKAHPGNIGDSVPARSPLDRLYISSLDDLEASAGNSAPQRELPTPPGPPGMGWERSLPGAFMRSRGRF